MSLEPVVEGGGVSGGDSVAGSQGRSRSNTEEVTVVDDESDLFSFMGKEPSMKCSFEDEDAVMIRISKIKNRAALFAEMKPHFSGLRLALAKGQVLDISYDDDDGGAY